MDIRPPKRQPAPQPVPRLAAPPPEPLLSSPPKPALLLAKNTPRWIRPRTVILAVLVLFVIGVLGVIWWFNNNLSAVSNDTTRKKITIETGMNVSQIAALLQRQGLIRNQTVFRLYTELTHTKDHLQAGGYLLSPSQSTQLIVSDLVAGKVEAFNVTIPPGLRLDQIKRVLERAGFDATAIDAAYAQHFDAPLLSSKPSGVSIEGYVFPDTYKITDSTTALSLLETTFEQFQKRLDASNIPTALQAQGLTLHQAITLASIIQKETSNATDQKQVAQVFLLRLKTNQPLQSDTTFIYASQLMGISPPTAGVDSPYNTYLHTGLPPGAIANFNFSALEAVVHPAAGDYLFFVAGDDGVTHFSHTAEEHNQNIAAYCHKLCAAQ